MTEQKKRTGFQNMDKERQREIASRGGKASHAEGGRGHEFTPEEALAAGSRGGKSLARDRKHMAEIGRRGGIAAKKRRDVEKAAKEKGRNEDLKRFWVGGAP
jgi:hypothetical protein